MNRRRGGLGWERGFVGVPDWVASTLVLAVLLVIAVTVLVLIPPAQRPRLEPPTPTGEVTSSSAN